MPGISTRLPLPAHQFLRRGINLPLRLGMLAFIILMLALIGHAIWHIQSLGRQMQEIVENHNKKVQLAADLLEATYNRHSALVYITLVEDPFERDERFQTFIKWGYAVGKARNELKAMPLNKYERGNLEHQDRLVQRIMLLQEEITDLAARDQIHQAQRTLDQLLRPLNLEFTSAVENLRRYERDHIRDALLAARSATRDVVLLHLGLGGLSLAVAGLIALATHRLLVRHTGTIQQQMSNLQEAGQRLEHQATHDALTGLANRTLFHRRMADELEHAQEENFMLGVMYLDLDDFKQVNDAHGHRMGDALLREVAQRLRHTVRIADTVARLGGDEFAILLPGLEYREQCQVMHDKIQKALAQPMELEGVSLTPKVSLGCVLYPLDGHTMDALMHAADQRMYARKHAQKTEESNPAPAAD